MQHCTSLQKCRPDPPDDQIENSPWHASVWTTQFSREGAVCSSRLSADPGQQQRQQATKKGKVRATSAGVRELQIYQPLTFHFPHIPDTHHRDNATLGWGHTDLPCRCVPFMHITASIGICTFCTGWNNCPFFSFLILPTIFTPAVLANLISNYDCCACVKSTAFLCGHLLYGKCSSEALYKPWDLDSYLNFHVSIDNNFGRIVNW